MLSQQKKRRYFVLKYPEKDSPKMIVVGNMTMKGNWEREKAQLTEKMRKKQKWIWELGDKLNANYTETQW